jgi:hypothetical protein
MQPKASLSHFSGLSGDANALLLSLLPRYFSAFDAFSSLFREQHRAPHTDGVLMPGVSVHSMFDSHRECLMRLLEQRFFCQRSPVAPLARASEIAGLPRDNFEIHETSKEEFEAWKAVERTKHCGKRLRAPWRV